MKITYKIFSDIIRQNTTSVDLSDVADVETYNHVENVLRERFDSYRVKFNHPGRTITVKRLEEDY